MAVPAADVATPKKSIYERAHYWVWLLTSRQLGRLVYGNDAGMLYNWTGRQELRHLRAIVRDGAGRKDDKRVEFLRREGYLRVTPVHDQQLLETIRSKVRRFMEDPNHTVVQVAGGAGSYQLGLVNPLKTIPEIATFVSDEIQDLVGAYYRTFSNVTRVSVWRNRSVPEHEQTKEVYSNYFHCDEWKNTRMKLFVNLCDVTRDTGPLRVYSLSWTRRIMRSGYLNRHYILGKARRIMNDPAGIVFHEGPFGSGILCNTQLCLHAASIPKEGAYRDILEICFEPSAIPLRKTWAEDFVERP